MVYARHSKYPIASKVQFSGNTHDDHQLWNKNWIKFSKPLYHGRNIFGQSTVDPGSAEPQGMSWYCLGWESD